MLTNLCTSEIVAHIDSELSEVITMVKRIENTIPEGLAQRWDPDYKPIKFIDALDSQILLPFELCTNWQVNMP
jgi:hypothetical protein